MGAFVRSVLGKPKWNERDTIEYKGSDGDALRIARFDVGDDFHSATITRNQRIYSHGRVFHGVFAIFYTNRKYVTLDMELVEMYSLLKRNKKIGASAQGDTLWNIYRDNSTRNFRMTKLKAWPPNMH